MKKLLAVLCLALFVNCGIIGPGHVGIVVNNMGSDRGVQNYTAKTGLVFFMPGASTIFEYPTFVQTAVWTASKDEGKETNEEMTFNTKEGSVVSGDISLSYQLIADSVPKFYVKFRSDDLENFTHGFLRNIARDAFNASASNFTLEEVYGLKKEQMLQDVKASINNQVSPYGVQLVQLGFVGALRMDPNIKAALNRKMQAIQDAIATENQLRQATAQAAKDVALANGQAQANALLAKSISPELIQWKQLEIQTKAIEKWDGRRPMVEGNSSGMMIQLPVLGQK